MTSSKAETQPVSAIDRESYLIEQLAQARSRLDDATAAWNERLKWQQINAAELFERRQSDRFKADLKALRADPFAMAGVFGRTWHSAAWLNCLWQAVLAGLSSAAGVTWEQIKNVVTATGGDWRADQVDIQRGRLVALFISLAPNPEAALKHWVADSLGMTGRNRNRKWRTSPKTMSDNGNEPQRTGRIEMQPDDSRETSSDVMLFESVMSRARHFLAMAPKADIAREALRATTTDELKIWPARAASLRQIHEAERDRCVAANVVLELGSASEIRETRRLRRDRERAERLSEVLERAIDALRKKSGSPAKRQTKATPAKSAEPQEPGHKSDGMSDAANDFEFHQAEMPCVTSIEPEANESRNAPEAECQTSSGQAIESGQVRSDPVSTTLPARRPDPAKLARDWRKRQMHRNRICKQDSNRSSYTAADGTEHMIRTEVGAPKTAGCMTS